MRDVFVQRLAVPLLLDDVEEDVRGAAGAVLRENIYAERDHPPFDRVAMDAAGVVATGLAGLDRNRAVVVPGWTNKLTAVSGRFAPRSVVRKIAGSIKY
jgi:molybdopterin biosynthesis enzyme